MTMNKNMVDIGAVKTGLIFFPEEVKNEIMKGLKAARYIFNGAVDEYPLTMYTTDGLNYINSNLAKGGTSFRIKSLDINDINRDFIDFMASFFEKYSQKLASATKAINNFGDDEVANCLNKFTAGACIAEVLFDASALEKIINEALKSQSQQKLLEETPEVIDAENVIDINKEIDREASEGEIPVPDEIIDAEEDQEEKNEETIAEDQEEKNEETIVSSSSEAEGFISDEKLLEKVGDKFFEEAKDKIRKIAKNKSLSKKQKKNRINRIVRSYSSKVKDADDPIKETEEKERIIASVVEDIKKPETIEEKNKVIIDSFNYKDTDENAFIKKLLRDNIKNISISKINECTYKVQVLNMEKNNEFYITWGNFEVINIGATANMGILVPMPVNPSLCNVGLLIEFVLKECLEIGTSNITQKSGWFTNTPSIASEDKKRAS